MKICKYCGNPVQDTDEICNYCGSREFSAMPQPETYAAPQPGIYAAPQAGTYAAPQAGTYAAPQAGAYAAPQAGAYAAPQAGTYAAPQAGYDDRGAGAPVNTGNIDVPAYNGPQNTAGTVEKTATAGGSVALGILGALLFSLGGVAIYVLLYQVGVVAAIAVLAIFFLARLGFNKLSRTENSILGTVVAIVVTAVMIYVAYYIAIRVSLMREVSCSFSEASELIKIYKDMPVDGGKTLQDAMMQDLGFSYGMWVISGVISFISSRKKRK